MAGFDRKAVQQEIAQAMQRADGKSCDEAGPAQVFEISGATLIAPGWADLIHEIQRLEDGAFSASGTMQMVSCNRLHRQMIDYLSSIRK